MGGLAAGAGKAISGTGGKVMGLLKSNPTLTRVGMNAGSFMANAAAQGHGLGGTLFSGALGAASQLGG